MSRASNGKWTLYDDDYVDADDNDYNDDDFVCVFC